MNIDAVLEFNQIKEELCGYAMSEGAKNRLRQLTISLKEGQCRSWQEETTRARKALDEYGTPPLTAMPEIDKFLVLSEAGSVLTPSQLLAVSGFLTACQRMEGYLKRAGGGDPTLASYGYALQGAEGLQNEIQNAIQGDRVQDRASNDLLDIRRSILRAEEKEQQKLTSLLRAHGAWFSDAFPVKRNGRYTLPVKREMKSRVPGAVIDYSASGGTCFIEPEAAAVISQQIQALEVQEENEVLRILYTLTDQVAQEAELIRANQRIMEDLDFMFAKGKLSQRLGGLPPEMGLERRITIRQGRHPLIPADQCVPLDFEIGGSVTGVTITGPNTGGKTVALKTVGLLCVMAQCGLHVPAGEGTYLCMNSQYLCDIGDGQSISENLSTFSAHMTNVIDILEKVNRQSLVLLDELGSGTDPAEGMGLAIAILEELKYRDCLFLATTHYPEVKTFAEMTPGVINARMAFDRESLRPLYRLEMGKAGESCALHIARRLGLPEGLLERAREVAYEGKLEPAAADSRKDHKAARRGVMIQKQQESRKHVARFTMGDSVTVFPSQEVGIVYRPEDDEGNLIVQVKGRKRTVSHKRVKLLAPASELYPPDYDFSIIFDTVEVRKARHQMSKRHVEGLELRQEPEGGRRN